MTDYENAVCEALCDDAQHDFKLSEALKDCPYGTKLYCELFPLKRGEKYNCTLDFIDGDCAIVHSTNECEYPSIKLTNGCYNKGSRYVLFPDIVSSWRLFKVKFYKGTLKDAEAVLTENGAHPLTVEELDVSMGSSDDLGKKLESDEVLVYFIDNFTKQICLLDYFAENVREYVLANGINLSDFNRNTVKLDSDDGFKFKIGDKVEILISVGYEGEDNTYGHITYRYRTRGGCNMYIVATPFRNARVEEDFLAYQCVSGDEYNVSDIVVTEDNMVGYVVYRWRDKMYTVFTAPFEIRCGVKRRATQEEIDDWKTKRLPYYGFWYDEKSKIAKQFYHEGDLVKLHTHSSNVRWGLYLDKESVNAWYEYEHKFYKLCCEIERKASSDEIHHLNDELFHPNRLHYDENGKKMGRWFEPFDQWLYGIILTMFGSREHLTVIQMTMIIHSYVRTVKDIHIAYRSTMIQKS